MSIWLSRFSLLTVCALSSACSKHAASPAQGTTAKATPAPTPQPGDSNNNDYVSITLECSQIPTPVPPAGKSAIVTRGLNYEDFGPNNPARPAQQITRRESGPLEGGTIAATTEQRAEIYRLALAALNQLPIPPEPAAPETKSCHLQVHQAVIELDTHVNLPSNEPKLASLVHALVPLLPSTP